MQSDFLICFFTGMTDEYIPDGWIMTSGDNGKFLKSNYPDPLIAELDDDLVTVNIYLGAEPVKLDKVVLYMADNILDVIVNEIYELKVSNLSCNVYV